MEYPTAQAYFDSLGFSPSDVEVVRGIVRGTLKKMVVFYGTGNNGKTALSRMLAQIVPVKHMSTSLTGGMYHYGPRPVFFECEPDGTLPSVDAWLKELKGEPLVVHTNIQPTVHDDDRVVVIEFTRKHTGKTLDVTPEFIALLKEYLL